MAAFFEAADVDSGADSGDTSDGKKRRAGQSDRARAGVFTQHGTVIPAGRHRPALQEAAGEGEQARCAQGVFVGTRAAGEAEMDSGDRFVARDSGARLSRRSEYAEGLVGAAEGWSSRSGRTLRDCSRRADAGGFHTRAARTGPIIGFGGHFGLQPDKLRRLRRFRGRRCDVYRAA